MLDPALFASHGVAPQEFGHRLCDGFGTLDVQEMADAIDRAVLDVRECRAQEVGDLHPQWLGVIAEHGQHGAVGGGCLFGAEPSLGQGRQLDAEERVGGVVRDADRRRGEVSLGQEVHHQLIEVVWALQRHQV